MRFGQVENRAEISEKTVTERRRRPRRVPGVILHDFGAKMEVKSLQKGEKMRSKVEALPRTTRMPQMAEKDEKVRKKITWQLTGSIFGAKKEARNNEKRGKKAMENLNFLGTVFGGVFIDFGGPKRR